MSSGGGTGPGGDGGTGPGRLLAFPHRVVRALALRWELRVMSLTDPPPVPRPKPDPMPLPRNPGGPKPQYGRAQS